MDQVTSFGSLNIFRETQEYKPWEYCYAECAGLWPWHASSALLCCQFLQMGFKPSNSGFGATGRPLGFNVPSVFIAGILNWFCLVSASGNLSYGQVTTSVLNRRKYVNVIPAGYRQYEILREKRKGNVKKLHPECKWLCLPFVPWVFVLLVSLWQMLWVVSGWHSQPQVINDWLPYYHRNWLL